WVCEHDAVYTTGRRGCDNRTVATLPAPLVHTDRGGETTFHGPGQLMLYPLIDLRRRRLGVRDYVSLLEASCIGLLERLGVAAQRRCGFPGVWTDRGKIAALGVRVQHGVAYHGMALNVDVDPAWFACIDPCGLSLPVDRLADHGLALPPDAELGGRWAAGFAALLPRQRHGAFTSAG
ncbi:MAG TPA: lipoyl(octanoyl) transferase LipB, partial [Mariprofundaceae bacterium]|nr:lipoyl(octanoyl) transferase LipB [Mariprofundaceae bacterium]